MLDGSISDTDIAGLDISFQVDNLVSWCDGVETTFLIIDTGPNIAALSSG